MTPPGARPPKRQYREFVRVQGEPGSGRFVIVAHPHPLHHATVTKEGTHRTGFYWVVRYPTFGLVSARVYQTESAALIDAADAIGRRTGQELMRFDAAQRYAMGQQKCPYREKGHPRLCDGPADPGTVWCGNHRGGKSTW